LSGWLLDTTVISVNAPGRPLVTPKITAWFEANASDMYMSVITVAEVLSGVEKMRRQGATKGSAQLADWFDQLTHHYGPRVLPFDEAAAVMAGRLTDRALSLGHAPGFADIAIAAIAAVRGFTVLTLNLRRFQPLGVACLSPFVQSSEV
jgi:predicted nucleic acid-binding protein